MTTIISASLFNKAQYNVKPCSVPPNLGFNVLEKSPAALLLLGQLDMEVLVHRSFPTAWSWFHVFGIIDLLCRTTEALAATGNVYVLPDNFLVFPKHPARIEMPMPDFVRILNRRINFNSSGRYYGIATLSPPTVDFYPENFEAGANGNFSSATGHEDYDDLPPFPPFPESETTSEPEYSAQAEDDPTEDSNSNSRQGKTFEIPNANSAESDSDSIPVNSDVILELKDPVPIQEPEQDHPKIAIIQPGIQQYIPTTASPPSAVPPSFAFVPRTRPTIKPYFTTRANRTTVVPIVGRTGVRPGSFLKPGGGIFQGVFEMVKKASQAIASSFTRLASTLFPKRVPKPVPVTE